MKDACSWACIVDNPAVAAAYSWDIFCRVIDNLGDIGVCWRLCADLARRGHQIRLWVDDPSALAWMAPGALEGGWPGVQVLHWSLATQPGTLASLAPAVVWVEGFGCELPPEFIAHRFGEAGAAASGPPVWINLEYLSAEAFALRSHGLPSPMGHGPARGQTRWFFYPGLEPDSGGLLREPGLLERQATFDRGDWLARQGIAWAGEELVSLFCYAPATLATLLQRLVQGPAPTVLLVAQGRGAQAVRTHLGLAPADPVAQAVACHQGALRTVFLPFLTQTDFDHLLWACDLNHVRGEDSFVRAVWAGQPFVWQIYPQDDGAHHAKLLAMLDALEAPPSWRRYHVAWNSGTDVPLPMPAAADWAPAVQRARNRLLAQTDLGQRLCAFVDARLDAAGTDQKRR